MIPKRPSPNILREIDESLRKAYESVLNEEVPERFKDLLIQLRAQESSPQDTGKGEQ